MDIITSSYQHKILFSEPVTGFITTNKQQVASVFLKSTIHSQIKEATLWRCLQLQTISCATWIPKAQFLVLLIASVRQVWHIQGTVLSPWSRE